VEVASKVITCMCSGASIPYGLDLGARKNRGRERFWGRIFRGVKYYNFALLIYL